MSDAIKPPVDVRICMILLLVSCTLKRPQGEARSQLTTPHYVQARTMTDNRTMTDKLPSLAACLGTFLLQPPVTSFVLFILYFVLFIFYFVLLHFSDIFLSFVFNKIRQLQNSVFQRYIAH